MSQQLPCSICSKTISNIEKYKQHLLWHIRKKCKHPECGMLCTSPHLNILKRAHTGEEAFSCSSCPQSFFSSSELEAHILTIHKRAHTGEKHFKCSLCPQSFFSSSKLKAHILTIHGEKPFSCSLCPQSFSRSSKLEAHILRHAKPKTFACLKCDRSFTQLKFLQNHCGRLHASEVLRISCKQSQSQEDQLRSEVKTSEKASRKDKN
jgi:uncharacterized Zn-finger protein